MPYAMSTTKLGLPSERFLIKWNRTGVSESVVGYVDEDGPTASLERLQEVPLECVDIPEERD